MKAIKLLIGCIILSFSINAQTVEKLDSIITKKIVSANKTIGIYPNPVTDDFRISGLSENAQVVLSDLSGRVVLRQKNVADNAYISMGSLPQGVYLVEMITGNEIITKKLIKKE